MASGTIKGESSTIKTEDFTIHVGSSQFSGYYYGDYTLTIDPNKIISIVNRLTEANRPTFYSLVSTDGTLEGVHAVRAYCANSNLNVYVRVTYLE